MYYGNAQEDRMIGAVDRRIGARTSGSSVPVPNYRGATPLKVWRRNDAPIEASTPTPVARLVAPVVTKPVPVVAKAVEAEALELVVETSMPTLGELWEAEQEAKERREKARLAKKTEAPPVVKPPEDFTPTYDLSRPKLKKSHKKAAKAKPVVRVTVERNLRKEMLERIDRLHPEACQAATTCLGAWKPSETFWTTEAFRTAVEKAEESMLMEMRWRFLDLAVALSWNLEQRAAK